MATNAEEQIISVRRRLGTVISSTLDSLEQLPASGRKLGSAIDMVTPLGRTLALMGILAWVGGWWLGWNELMVMAAGGLLLFVGAGLFVVGRTALEIQIALEPHRVIAGDPSAGQILVSNQSNRRTLPSRIELPVGVGIAEFHVPSLGPKEQIEEVFVVPTERRGVIAVGPATSVRSDPLGILHREADSSAGYELMVHPHTVPLEPFGSGLLRDLEGVATNDLSVSDLAFHALREYAPGDDRRYVHWRSSAKAGRLLIRQFQDTRRSTLCVVVDANPSSYGHAEEFETAMEVTGSIALRACQDRMSSTIVVGNQVASGVIPHMLLDTLSRASLDGRCPDLITLIDRAIVRGNDISYAVLVSGSNSSTEELQRAATRFPVEIRALTMRIAPGESPRVSPGGRALDVRLGELAQLPNLLRTEAAA